MRTTYDSSKIYCKFVGDHSNGSCFVETPDGEMTTDNMGVDGEPFYLKSGEEIFYPGWASW